MRGAPDRGARCKNVEYVRARPFSNWLNERYEVHLQGEPAYASHAMTLLLGEIGWPTNEAGSRRLYRYRHCVMSGSCKGVKGSRPTEWFERDVVEDALHFAGQDFYELYGEYAHERDLPLEPAAWCPSCQSHVTPINGCCPWDDWVISEGHMNRLAA